MKQEKRSLWNKFWYSPSGKLSLIELPNIPLLLAALCWIASILMKQSSFHHLFSELQFGFLFVWSWLEITKGESYFRKVLGLTVLILIIYNKF
jgi:hypothetical protein